jgi:hypothetical protein
MESPKDSKPGRELALDIVGVWWLLSREDFAADGSGRIDLTLGADPLGILTYAPSHFAAQFMKRDRSNETGIETSVSGQNNTGAIGGYDAYFGTYEVDEFTGDVVHRLEGALTVDNVGIEVSRNVQVKDDRLVIQLDTTTTAGEPVTRTLTWQRIG